MNLHFIPLLIFGTLGSAQFDLNDVSILMSLPSSSHMDDLLKADDIGEGGELLPRRFFEKLGPMNNASSDSSHIYENLRAVSLRFDPVASELRIVWQPVVPRLNTSGGMTTEDTAVHTFYHLEADESLAFGRGLLALKSEMAKEGVSTQGLALQIHPAHRDPRTHVRFSSGLRRLVLTNVGEKNFSKLTAMKLLAEENWWKFIAGVVKSPTGVWQSGVIPRLGTSEVDIINNAHEDDEIDASIFSVLSYPARDDIRSIISTSYRKTFKSSEPNADDLPTFRNGLGAIHRFQNPHLTNPTTIDCAHCHLADSAQVFATKVFGELRSTVENHPDKYVQPVGESFNLSNSTIARRSTKVMRAFGYFGDQPSIMTRTIHDSAESAAALNR